MVFAKPRRAAGHRRRHRVTHSGPDIQLRPMPLAIIEPDGLDTLEPRQRPGQTGRRILPAGKEDEGGHAVFI